MFGLNITEGNKEIEDPESRYEYLYVLKKEMYTKEHQKFVKKWLKKS
jgi:hypothetical protein